MTALHSNLQAESHHVIRLEGTGQTAVETGRNRLSITVLVFAFVFAVLCGRLIELGVLRTSPAHANVASAAHKSINRANITDRRGNVMATDLTTQSLFADARKVINVKYTVRQLTALFPELDPDDLTERLTSGKADIWLRRHLTPTQQYAINELGIPGLGFKRESRRVYPQGRTAPHIVGLVDLDNNGTAGIEKQFDDRLTGKGNRDLILSIDLRVQHVLEQELFDAMTTFKAIGATGVVLDANTGEVIAMSSLPDYDPNAPLAHGMERWFNRATLGLYEMGSTFKIFNTAIALDTGTVTLRSGYDARKPIKIGRFTIRDFHGKRRWLSVPEIFQYSSNIGSAKMALEFGAKTQKAYLKALGLIDPLNVELPEVGKPKFPARWGNVHTMTISYGHGIAVSPLQLTAAVASVVNGGFKIEPTLIRQATPPARVRVLSETTSAQMRALMRLVVEKGTGRKADVAAYPVIGKTGTADKPGRGGYSERRLISSFVGAFPAKQPKYVVLVMLDEPKGNKQTYGYATGGWVAAPTLSRIVERIGPLLGLMPDLPQKRPGADISVASFN